MEKFDYKTWGVVAMGWIAILTNSLSGTDAQKKESVKISLKTSSGAQPLTEAEMAEKQARFQQAVAKIQEKKEASKR